MPYSGTYMVGHVEYCHEGEQDQEDLADFQGQHYQSTRMVLPDTQENKQVWQKTTGDGQCNRLLKERETLSEQGDMQTREPKLSTSQNYPEI